MKKHKVLNIIAVILVTLGVTLLIGTAGGLECDTITINQAIVQGIISLGITVLGGRLFSATYNHNDYYYEEEEDYE